MTSPWITIFIFIFIITNIPLIEIVAKEIYKNESDINLVVVLHNCKNSSTPLRIQTLSNAAIWTVKRLNFLQVIAPLQIGITIQETCTDSEDYRIIFNIFQNQKYILGVVGDFSEKIQKFCEVLNIKYHQISSFSDGQIGASIELLTVLGDFDNVTVISHTGFSINKFLESASKNSICIRDYYFYEKNPTFANLSDRLVIFGEGEQLKNLIKTEEFDEMIPIFVPLDGSALINLPDSYLIQPPLSQISRETDVPFNIFPTPLLFQVATPLITFIDTASKVFKFSCNESMYKLNCLRSEYSLPLSNDLLPMEILTYLKIETLKNSFVYNIFKVTNHTYTKLFTFNIFQNTNNNNKSKNIDQGCKNFENNPKLSMISSTCICLKIRNEPWVFVFLSLSLIGLIFCLAILIFIISSIIRRDILEGNPILTLLLLIFVMMMFSSVLPLCVEGDDLNICLIRSLTITLSFAGAFSLILSRCILLATASKEIGFMSHISGPVQSFLCFFIFAVQVALSSQVIWHCKEIWKNIIFFLFYNCMLLILTVCICPRIFHCQRNYREGKYFVVGIFITALVWAIWIPFYMALDDEWKDPILCFALISTGGVLLGTIFVPRTYLMTIAVARNKLTSTLPSLNTATSVLDMYRNPTQPVYDCVNIAAVNAVNVARAGISSITDPDLYISPHSPEDVGFEEIHCTTPNHSDKITKF